MDDRYNKISYTVLKQTVGDTLHDFEQNRLKVSKEKTNAKCSS